MLALPVLDSARALDRLRDNGWTVTHANAGAFIPPEHTQGAACACRRPSRQPSRCYLTASHRSPRRGGVEFSSEPYTKHVAVCGCDGAGHHGSLV